MVNSYPPPAVSLEARRREIEFANVSFPSHGVEQDISRNLFLALQVRNHSPIRSFLDAGDLFIESQRDAIVAQMVTKRLHNLLVRKLKQSGPFFDKHDPDSKSRKHRSVLDTNNAATDNDQSPRDNRHITDLIAIDDRF